MIRKWFGFSALVLVASSLLSLSCARNQHLQAVNIVPSTVTYSSAVPQGVQQSPVKLTAYGSFIHPPETKDVTSEVTWTSDIPDVATVDSAGNLTAGAGCGVTNVSASFYTSGNTKGNVVVGFMSVTVKGPASLGCPQGSSSTNNLLVDVSNGNDGSIVSSPGGIVCGFACGASFPTGTSVTLTATPNDGHNFIGWNGCDTQSTFNCVLTMNGDRIVTASFD